MSFDRKESRKLFFAAFSLSLVLLAVVMVGTVLAVQPTMPEQNAVDSSYRYRPLAADTLTMVVVGTLSDGTPQEFLLMRFNPQYGQIPVTLLPPKTRVTYEETESTLLEVYENKGVQALKQALSGTFGIAVERYAVLSGGPFLRVAAKAGSVSYTLPYEISYTQGDTSVHYAAGEQHLDGQDILNLFGAPALRKDPVEKSVLLGDLIAAVINQNIQAGQESRASGLFKLAVNLVKTDITYADFEVRRESAAFLADMEHRQIAGNLPLEGEWENGEFVTSEGYHTLIRQYFQPLY